MADPSLPHRDAIDDFVEELERRDLSTVQRLVLFGSVVRADHSVDSDIDVLAVLDDSADVSAVEERLRDIAYDVTLDRGVAFSIHAVSESTLERREGHPFFENVLAEGRAIYG